MSSGQGWFESDDEYQDRMERESNEKTIEDSTGSVPSQGWFESDDSYTERIATEAHESIIENNTGSAPSQGWLESDDAYQSRVEQEANESIIEHSGDGRPSQGWFESDDDYNTRVRMEANERCISDETGSGSRQGWFEGDYEYRQRINREANIARVERYRNKSGGEPDKPSAAVDKSVEATPSPAGHYSGSNGDYPRFASSYDARGRTAPSGSTSSSGALAWIVVAVAAIAYVGGSSWFYGVAPPTFGPDVGIGEGAFRAALYLVFLPGALIGVVIGALVAAVV